MLLNKLSATPGRTVTRGFVLFEVGVRTGDAHRFAGVRPRSFSDYGPPSHRAFPSPGENP